MSSRCHTSFTHKTLVKFLSENDLYLDFRKFAFEKVDPTHSSCFKHTLMFSNHCIQYQLLSLHVNWLKNVTTQFLGCTSHLSSAQRHLGLASTAGYEASFDGKAGWVGETWGRDLSRQERKEQGSWGGRSGHTQKWGGLTSHDSYQAA